LKRFLNKHLYSHEQKLEMTRRAQQIVRELFQIYMSDVEHMPEEFSEQAEKGDTTGRARVVADYIAGMTDRYAIAEHERIVG
jgi:dGTPase